MGKPSLQRVLRAGFAALLLRGKQRLAVHRWYHAVMACRTAALGGHRMVCPEGHVDRVLYNSCKHRACPQCGGLETERWVQRMRAQQLLDCDYYHVILTVPHELNEWWQWNRVWFGNQLLGAARETVLELLANPRWLGALPGVLLTLHTWGRNLTIHPHVHALVTGGGWASDGWRRPQKSILLPSKVVRQVFRGKLRARLRAGVTSGALQLPTGQRANQALSLLNQLGRREWSARVQPPYRHGQGVVRYLARYVRRGPFSAAQLEWCDGIRVSFRHTDHRDGRTKPLCLPVAEWADRLGQHVPEPGFRMVRHAGLWAPGHRDLLAQCRGWLGMASAEPPAPLSVLEYLEQLGHEQSLRCPQCGRLLVVAGWVEPTGVPPPEEVRRAA